MTASGTSGRSVELSAYGRLDRLAAVVVKSLNADGWAGNPEPRLAYVKAGMINSIGLQGPGVERWLSVELPALISTGADVVASIWGATVDDYRRAAKMLAEAPPQLVAVEVNLSCPNTEAGWQTFAGSAEDAQAVLKATDVCGRPRWAKLSPAVGDLIGVAEAAAEGGAEAVVLTNTLPGVAIDLATRRPVLGGHTGGVSGAALHAVALRAVFDVHAALPELPIVGVGGVDCGADAVAMILAGASAVQVGTAAFADPRAPWRVMDELADWCRDNGVSALDELTGAAHGR